MTAAEQSTGGKSRSGLRAAEPSRAVESRFGLPDGWWPLAHSEEVGNHPSAFRLGRQDLAVYRDLTATVRAVEDRCPHRRLPLSMGRLTEDGSLQCPYHGWSFDGATGRCTAIPNLSTDERIPNGIKVTAFSAVENIAEVLGYGVRTSRLAPAVGPPTGEEPDAGTTMYDARLVDGMVFVWTGSAAPTTTPDDVSGSPSTAPACNGTLEIRAPHIALTEAILWNPGAALGLGPLLGAGDELCAPAVTTEEGYVSVQRERYAYDLPRVSTFGPISRRVITSTIATDVLTGFTRVSVQGGRWAPSCEVTIGLTPVDTYRTALRWRLELAGAAHRSVSIGTQAWLRARHLSGRACEASEALADNTFRGTDGGIRALREARRSTLEALHEGTDDQGATQ
jgi:nitrite reductase/ring-hydroxylating ferredoxin subunit